MKVIANRFKIIFPKIIGVEQAGFIAGRNITDNVIIAQEVIHSMKSSSKRKWMTIKIDLEKAYDRVRWDFIKASLQAAGPPISHLFFADDLVIFSKVDMKHSRLIRNILGRFCDFSGHKVNARKTNIFFAKGLDETVVDSISSLFGFQKVQNLGHYLGIPLFHQRVTNGRITLAQSVLMAIPDYFMQSMMIPRSICDEIESLVKQFIWGSSEHKRKMSLVGWDSICQPKCCGGLSLWKLLD
ncbi:hypothetical protein PVK06_019908 [Gossypium arboreum]|uniref:Reverse transcriptase domain-containing protein n=1 Tax=Gossypium arboreum TaxID=29729 RepID=A0ABR0PL94_GOSAR|nr:hypothetical protein PVK06_019908 [Gossypium arboreum]